MDRLAHILVPVDFSSASADAIRQAARLASWSRASLHAVHVVEPTLLFAADMPLLVPPVTLDADLIDNARAQWAGFVPDLPGRSGVDFRAVLGSPIDEISRLAREVYADLIVLGAHGRSHPANALGALAASVVRHAPTRVLIVRAGHLGPFQRIVLATDFSETSAKAFDQAARLAAQDAAELHVVHAHADPLSALTNPATVLGAMPDFAARYALAAQQRVQRFIDERGEMGRFAKPVAHAIAHEHHARAIVEFALAHKADLIVLGTRGRSGLRELFLGSTAERVIREAHCTTLVVPPG
jgi:nucleotide-binding universal stress UspA family protein